MNREELHRKRKREIEAEETIKILRQHFQKSEKTKLNILEFGAGACDQVKLFQQLGNVTATDIYTHGRLKDMDINFIECSITETPFTDDEFDLIYANHVIAHIGEARSHGLEDAFAEMKRIGKKECLFAFSVPTTLWLWLSIPTHYFVLIRGLCRKLFGLSSKKVLIETKDRSTTKNVRPKRRKWFELLLPQGLGTYRSFGEANKGFQLKSWVALFESYGLFLKAQEPLAVYGASEFPVVPTTRWFNRFDIASSRLLIFTRTQ